MSALKAFSARPVGTKPRCAVARAEPINQDIRKDEAKVVDMMSVDDLPKKAVLCRCWKSTTFPMCNGSHVAHNKDTGDNVGPLIINKESS